MSVGLDFPKETGARSVGPRLAPPRFVSSTKHRLAAWTILMFTAGCSTTTTYRRPTSATEAAWILDKLGTSEVELVTSSGKDTITRRGVLAPLDAHKFSFTESAGPSLVIPFEQTPSITYKSRVNGASFGFLYGAIPGVLAGFVSGMLLEKTLCEMGDQDPSRCESGAVIGTKLAVLGGLLTGVVGAVIGAAVGKDMTLRF